MRNSGRYLRRSGLCVPDLLSLRGVDASLGQIAVRNRSFPESPTRDEPLIRLRFVAVHESASLIGQLGSSAFRLSTAAASMSLAGSCFSPESAHRPFHHGIRRRGGTIF